MCKCVCDALNPIDLQICYQGQIVHQGKMSLSGHLVEVDPTPIAKFGSSSLWCPNPMLAIKA